jgi:HEAT repeat protein
MSGIKFWFGVIALTGISFGFYHYLQNETKLATDDSIETASQSDTNNASIMAHEERSNGKFNEFDFHITPGKSYAIEFNRSLKGEALGENNNTKSFGDSEFTGTMTIHSVKFNNSKINAVIQLQMKKLVSPLFDFSIAYEFGTLSTGNTPIAEITTNNKFKNTLLFELTPTGRVLRIFNNSVKPLSQDAIFIVHDIVTSSLFPMPEEKNLKGSNKFKQRVADEKNNKYDMDFIVSGKSTDEWTIDAKNEVVGSNSDSNNRMGLDGSSLRTIEIKWNTKSGLPKTYTAKTEQKINAGDAKIAGVQSVIETKWQNSTDSLFNQDDLKNFPTQINLDQIKATRRQNKEKDSKPKTWSETEKKIAQYENMDEKQKETFFNDTADQLKKNPALLSRYQNEIKNLRPGSESNSVLVGSIGALGTSEAQAAMVEIYQRGTTSDAIKEKILIELATSPQALTNETKGFLKDLYHNSKDEDTSHQAGFALGASLSKSPDAGIVKEFQTKFENSSNKDEKVFLLSAMGNSKTDDFKRQIDKATDSKDPEIRAAAADALRFSKDENSRSQLISLTKDESPNTKISAYRALLYQPYDDRTFNALTACANSESNISVRATCTDILLSKLNDEKTFSFISRRATIEPNEPLRMKIQEAIKPVN